MKFKEASFYKKLPNKKVHCTLCPHECIIDNGEVGICKVRMNIVGNLKSMNYGKPHLIKHERIENIGMFHFMPNSETLAIGNPGINLKLDVYGIKNEDLDKIATIDQDANQIIKQAQKSNAKIITYSFAEPTMYFEYLKDVADNSRRLKHIIVTSGYANEAPVRQISKMISASLIDIKSMNENFYETVLEAKLDPVLHTARILHENNVWIEVKMDLIPHVHEDFYDVRRLIGWIMKNLDANVPVHFTAKNNINPEIVTHAKKIATNAGLNYVYTHNIPNSEQSTYCPSCKKLVIERSEGHIENHLVEGRCKCGKEIAGIWQ